MPPGCIVEADAFTLTSSDAAYTRTEEAWGFSAAFNVSLDFFTEGINASSLARLVNKSHEASSAFRKISFARARQMIADDERQLPQWHLPLLAGLPSLATVIMIALTVHAFYVHCKLMNQQQPPTPPYGAVPQESQPVINNSLSLSTFPPHCKQSQMAAPSATPSLFT